MKKSNGLLASQARLRDLQSRMRQEDIVKAEGLGVTVLGLGRPRAGHVRPRAGTSHVNLLERLRAIVVVSRMQAQLRLQMDRQRWRTLQI